VRDEGVVYRPRFNLAPGDQHWIVRKEGGVRLVVPAKWGFPTSFREPSEGSRTLPRRAPGGGATPRPRETSQLLINARVETAARRPAFRDAYRGRRCLVPADGFYEWRAGQDQRLPSWYHHADGSLLLMAGLYTSASRPAFTILTMPANDVVAPAHDRMPVVLSPEAARAWLEDPRFDPTAASVRRELGRDLVATPVSTRVNSTAYDGPECLEPPKPEAPPRQLTLLD